VFDFVRVWACVYMVLVNILMINCLIFIKQNVCIDCEKVSLCQICMWNALFHPNGGCRMHGFTGIVGAESMVSPKWWVRNARFHRNGGCRMHSFTGMVGAECTVQPD